MDPSEQTEVKFESNCIDLYIWKQIWSKTLLSRSQCVNPSTQETESCEEGRNCFRYVWTWSPWSTCILDVGAICGRGRRTRYKECRRNQIDKVPNEICSQVRFTSIEIRTWISNYTHGFMLYIMTHPCPNFSGGLTKPPLKLGHGWEIAPIVLCWSISPELVSQNYGLEITTLLYLSS